jgi:hypothetical protein
MTATTVPVATRTEPSWSHVLRIALVTVAVALLLAGAFVLGRLTVHSAHAAPAVTPAPVVTTTLGCRMGRPC